MGISTGPILCYGWVPSHGCFDVWSLFGVYASHKAGGMPEPGPWDGLFAGGTMISVALPSQVPLPADHAMTVWVIYDHPSDFPDGFVLRPQFVVKGQREPVASNLAWYGKTIDDLRAILPGGLTAMGDPNPVIAEVWI